MKSIRIIGILLLSITLFLIAIFYNDLRGYEEVERINEWVLYYDEDGDWGDLYPQFLVRSGFEEKALDDAIEENIFTNDELQEIMNYVEAYSE